MTRVWLVVNVQGVAMTILSAHRSRERASQACAEATNQHVGTCQVLTVEVSE